MKKEITFKATAINPKTGEKATFRASREAGKAQFYKNSDIHGGWHVEFDILNKMHFAFEDVLSITIYSYLRDFRRWATSEIGECAVEMYAIRSGVRDHGRCRILCYEIAEKC